MTVEILHTLVSSAIWRAEQLDAIGLETEAAWIEVSKLEEELARLLPASAAEGRIARRGAVRAALKAQDFVRAQDLAERFAAEDGAPRALRADLREMLKADAKGLSEQFPFASKHHKPSDVQMLANLLLQRGPFWLAAA
jgi:hypothetical protein